MSWKSAELFKVCEVFADGDWIESKDQSDSGIRLIQTGNVGIGRFKARDSKARYINEDTFKRLRCTEIKEGDILVSRLPDPVGRACIIPPLVDKLITAVDCTIIRTKKDILSPNYLNYYCQSPQYFEQVKKNITGATRQRISRSLLGKTLVPIASLTQQQKIVAKLDAIFTEIDIATAAAEANANNAEALFQSYLNEVFDKQTKEYKNVTVGEVCSIINGGTPKSEVSEYWNGDLNWITPKEMGKLIGREIYSTERKITDKGMKNSSAKLLPINSIILSSRAPIGHLAINKELMATNQGCKGLAPKESLDYEYLYYFLLKSKRLLNDMGSGTTFKELSGTKLATVILPLPKILIQKNTVSKLDMIFGQVQIAKTSFKIKQSNLTLLKQAILQRAFGGELVKD